MSTMVADFFGDVDLRAAITVVVARTGITFTVRKTSRTRSRCSAKAATFTELGFQLSGAKGMDRTTTYAR